MDTIVMLQELLEQNQFELITEEDKEMRLVYLMNDAVESFLVLCHATMTGEYDKDYDGVLSASLSHEDGRYILVVHQGESVVTIFFDELKLEVHLYDYGEIGHFWVKGYEYLRQLEYRIAILSDKYEYLGERYCTMLEGQLACLADFPPLNDCCYAAVPKQYIVPRKIPWMPTAEAMDVMQKLAEEAEDFKLLKMLKFYRRHPYHFLAKRIARKLHQNAHAKVIDLLTEKLKEAASGYPRRSYGAEQDAHFAQLIEAGKKRQQELASQGKDSMLLREEPFTTAKDDLDFHVYLMIWKKGIRNRKVEVYKL